MTGLRLWFIKPNAADFAGRYLLRHLIANVSYFLFWILAIRQRLWNNEVVRESKKQRNANTARTIESAHRTALANGLVGIREKTPSPSLAEFFKTDFVPCVETKHAAKPETAEYRQPF